MNKTIIMTLLILLMAFVPVQATNIIVDRHLNSTWVSNQIAKVNPNYLNGIKVLWITNSTTSDPNIFGQFDVEYLSDRDTGRITAFSQTQVTLFQGALSSEDMFHCVLLHELGHWNQARNNRTIQNLESLSEDYADNFAYQNGCKEIR